MFQLTAAVDIKGVVSFMEVASTRGMDADSIGHE